MKILRCSCSRKRTVEDNILIVICPECQKPMQEIKKEGEDGKRN
jgi:Zn finger protein HypA/HybF involved in hydrogenase expression